MNKDLDIILDNAPYDSFSIKVDTLVGYKKNVHLIDSNYYLRYNIRTYYNEMTIIAGVFKHKRDKIPIGTVKILKHSNDTFELID